MLVAVQLVGIAVVPLNVTVLAPCVELKFVPVIVTAVPRAPEFGLKLAMFGPAGAVVPVPVKEIDMGAMLALFAIFRFPAVEPVAVGEKVTLTAQLPFAPRGEEAIQLSVSEKSLVAATPSTFTVPPPALLRVTC